MLSLKSQKNQEIDPDDLQGLKVSLMAKAAHFRKTRDMDRIVNNKKKSTKEQIASLQELVKEARREIKEEADILFQLALPVTDFRILKKIMRNSDIAKIRQELGEVLDEKEIPYKHLL